MNSHKEKLVLLPSSLSEKENLQKSLTDIFFLTFRLNKSKHLLETPDWIGFTQFDIEHLSI